MKLGIVGSGMIVREVLPILQELEIELVAITGTKRSESVLVEIKEKYNFKNYYTDYDLMLEDDSIDTIYIALPNNYHFEYSKKALLSGKNVICEKPFTLKSDELRELIEIAKSSDLIILEAITNQYLGNYLYIKEQVKSLGDIKLIECNYSQYSSRYDSFKMGNILPAFDAKKGGGALMDINIYNIHFVVGILGKPLDVIYFPNIERNVDTSGILILDYKNTKVVCIGAKDSSAEISSTIQGEKGFIRVNGATNTLPSVTVDVNREKTTVNKNEHEHRMYSEFKIFKKIIESNDIEFSMKCLEHSLTVMEIVDKAKKTQCKN